jgi:hypothetical protein
MSPETDIASVQEKYSVPYRLCDYPSTFSLNMDNFEHE